MPNLIVAPTGNEIVSPSPRSPIAQWTHRGLFFGVGLVIGLVVGYFLR